jgi:hypothetical protein
MGLAVSARMNPALREEILATPEERWPPYSEGSQVLEESAQVDYFPEESAENGYREPLRCMAIRMRNKEVRTFRIQLAVCRRISMAPGANGKAVVSRLLRSAKCSLLRSVEREPRLPANWPASGSAYGRIRGVPVPAFRFCRRC